jgi:hypothetical protein
MPAEQPALRLTFAYQGATIQLVGREELTKVPLPSDPLEGFAGQSGFWAELRDAAGTLLYRQVLHRPVAFHAEFVSDDPATAGFPQRVAIPSPAGQFVVLVPAPAAATTLVLVSSPLTHDAPATPAVPVATFDIRGPIV